MKNIWAPDTLVISTQVSSRGRTRPFPGLMLSWPQSVRIGGHRSVRTGGDTIRDQSAKDGFLINTSPPPTNKEKEKQRQVCEAPMC